MRKNELYILLFGAFLVFLVIFYCMDYYKSRFFPNNYDEIHAIFENQEYQRYSNLSHILYLNRHGIFMKEMSLKSLDVLLTIREKKPSMLENASFHKVMNHAALSFPDTFDKAIHDKIFKKIVVDKKKDIVKWELNEHWELYTRFYSRLPFHKYQPERMIRLMDDLMQFLTPRSPIVLELMQTIKCGAFAEDSLEFLSGWARSAKTLNFDAVMKQCSPVLTPVQMLALIAPTREAVGRINIAEYFNALNCLTVPPEFLPILINHAPLKFVENFLHLCEQKIDWPTYAPLLASEINSLRYANSYDTVSNIKAVLFRDAFMTQLDGFTLMSLAVKVLADEVVSVAVDTFIRIIDSVPNAIAASEARVAYVLNNGRRALYTELVAPMLKPRYLEKLMEPETLKALLFFISDEHAAYFWLDIYAARRLDLIEIFVNHYSTTYHDIDLNYLLREMLPKDASTIFLKNISNQGAPLSSWDIPHPNFVNASKALTLSKGAKDVTDYYALKSIRMSTHHIVRRDYSLERAKAIILFSYLVTSERAVEGALRRALQATVEYYQLKLGGAEAITVEHSQNMWKAIEDIQQSEGEGALYKIEYPDTKWHLGEPTYTKVVTKPKS